MSVTEKLDNSSCMRVQCYYLRINPDQFQQAKTSRLLYSCIRITNERGNMNINNGCVNEY